jgi:hypothetical protein
MNGFKVEAVLTRCASTVDGGLSLGFHTKELDPIEKVGIMEFHNKAGWMLFSPNQIEESDVPTIPAEIGSKTPSQRLRAVLYIMWQQQIKAPPFEEFYLDRMELLINQIKERLDN